MGLSSDQELNKSGMQRTRRSVEPLSRNDDAYPYPQESGAELLLRTIISVNQLSVYGAIAGCCGEMAQQLAQQLSDHAFSITGKPVAKMGEQLDCKLSPEVLSVITKPLEIDVPAQGNLLRNHSWSHERSFSGCFVSTIRIWRRCWSTPRVPTARR